MFDAFVLPILNYGCEVWGFNVHRELERVHLTFCKRILGVKDSASLAGVYGELGRFPLYVKRTVNIVKFWFKMVKSDNTVLKTVYHKSFIDCVNGENNWVTRLKTIFDNYGFSYAIDNTDVLDNSFLHLFEERVKDTFIQNWHEKVNSSSILILYKELKSTFEIEPYLHFIKSFKLRSNLTKMRISAHNLRINTGRYVRPILERINRKCVFCNDNDIEDEFHFILKCSAFAELRNKFIKKYFFRNNSMYKLIELFKSNSNSIIRLSKFLSFAKSKRETLLTLT